VTVRAAAVAGVIALAAAFPALAPAGAAPRIDVFEARAEAGGIHDSLAIPAYFETFLPYSLDEASNGSSHGYHSVFYAGFFLTAAAQQFGVPNPPGTTETLYPQGPTMATGQGVPVPGAQMASSRGTSAATHSDGQSTAGASDLGGAGTIGFGQATTSVDAGSVVKSVSHVVLHDVLLGGGALAIRSVDATSTAVADGVAGGAHTTESLTMEGATLLGFPVELSPTGLRLAGSAASLPGVPPVDDLLARAGLTVARLPNVRSVAEDGTTASEQVGGITVTFAQPAQEFTVTTTLGRVSASARALPPLPAAAPATLLPSAAGPVAPGTAPAAAAPTPAVPALAVPPRPPASPSDVLVRVRRTRAARGLDVTTVAALLALLALAAGAAPRAFRAAAAP
jgi:hypothetical protein